MKKATSSRLQRAIPLWLIVTCALAFHAPLLLLKVPSNSFDAHFHMSMASHYAHHWFDPWNEKSLAGFSQTTYPPLTHQWIAIFSHAIGLDYGFMLVIGICIILLPVAVFRFAKLWVNERAASYGAFCSIFLGSLCLLTYQDGQIGTVSSTTLFLLSIPFGYEYVLTGSKSELIMGVAMACTAAAAHHATLLFGLAFFVFPVIWLVIRDFRAAHPDASIAIPIRRIVWFMALAGTGILVVLLPYVLTMEKSPILQTPIPHLSRANFLLQPIWGLHYWLLPVGTMVLALPYIFYKGGEQRLRPLVLGFYAALLFGLGGTTPVPRWILGRAFDILTFERFTFWALLLAMPFVGLLAVHLINRFRVAAAAALFLLVVGWGCFATAWNVYFPLIGAPINVDPVIQFLNENGHDRYRYLTLGFANALSRIACYTNASSVDGEYNSGRSLPEMTLHGSAQLSSAKFYGTDGIASLEAMLRHAPRYGLRYIFVADAYYEPLLTFAGWRQIETLNKGQITVWTNPDIPYATPIASPLRPPRWQGYMWGTLPFGVSILTIVLAAVRKRKKVRTDMPVRAKPHANEPLPLGAVARTVTPALPSAS
jgi:hypothetical protein